MKWIIVIIGVFAFIPTAVAQQSTASFEFFSTLSDCSASLGGWKCLELDLSSETAEKTDTTKRKKFQYSWSMGEGSRKQGEKIEHCYEQFGSYQVKMDLIDPETNTVIRNDLSATAYLFPEIRPAINSSSQGNLASAFQFEALYDHPEIFTPDNVYWRIDGKYYEGARVSHTFHAAGTYQIEMAIVKDTELTGLLTACATKEITVLESDIWTTDLVRHFEKARERFHTGPFLKSDVFCLLVAHDSPHDALIVPLRMLMSEGRVKEDHAYDVQLFSGNLFTHKKELNMHGLTGNDLLTALKDTVLSFSRGPVHALPSVMADRESTELFADAIVAQAAEPLINNPWLRIQVGSYIHAGSRAEKGIQTSLQTAAEIRQLLISKGIAEDRISIAHPDHNRALFNTCSGSPNCGHEDQALNNKIEFKITGFTL